MNTIQKKRIPIIDIARFYAMVLVYYGHIVEQVMYLGSAQATAQYKCIYSFHMPLFFLLSGTIASDEKLSRGFGRFFKRIMASRLVPFLFFSLLMCAASLFISGWFPLGALADSAAYGRAAVKTLQGFPAFCIPLWFMALLVMVELFHYGVSRVVRRPAFIAVTAAVLYLVGFYLNRAFFFVQKDILFWFFNEVPVVYCFYAAGVLLRKSGWLEKEHAQKKCALAALVCLIIVLLTYDLNDGPFRIIQAVVIVLSGHGHLFWFVFTAFVGSIFVLLLAGSAPNIPWMQYLGRNALSLFCLNGVFYHFINPDAAKWFSSAFEMAHVSVFLYSAAMTVISFVLCLPVIHLLTTRLPQIMGKPARKGPWLRPLIRD
jgi:acyltransferase